MISIIFWSVWRRLYGEGDFKKILSRTIQTIIAVLILGYQLYTELDIWSILIVLIDSLWIIIQYWSRAIGEIIDAGLNHHQDKDSYDRWFRIPLDWIYDKLGKEKYVGFYDFWYSSIRYAIGALPLFFYSWVSIFLVPFQYFIYLACHKLFIKYPSLYSNKVLQKLRLNESKNIAEVIHGALFGLIIGLI